MREEIARLLLKVGAVTLRPGKPFLWASGIQSPIYCDNRLILSDRRARNLVVAEFEKLIRKGKIRYEAIAGIATGGIPYAAILADHLKKPMLYVRSAAKKHGKGKQVEGKLEKGSRILLIEDLVSTGQSSLAAVRAIKQSGAFARHCLAIFSYGLAASQKAFEKANCQLYTLTNLETLLTVALKDGWISREEKGLIQKFSQDPKGWLKKKDRRLRRRRS
jgi:orotate phosphoribosyltransferase